MARAVSCRASKATKGRATPVAWDRYAEIESGKLYASWNGATELAFWGLQGRAGKDSDFHEVDIVEKSRFEQRFELISGMEIYTH